MKILLVEDSPILRERLRGIVASIPRAVVVAESDSADDAGRQLDTHRPDVAVIDLHLRGGSGLAVIEHIRAAHPATIAIVLTNLADAEYQDKCMTLGAHYFFDKSKEIGAFTNLLADLGLRRAGAT